MARKSNKTIGRSLKAKLNSHKFDLELKGLPEDEYSSRMTKILSFINTFSQDSLKNEFDVYVASNQQTFSMDLQKAKPSDINTLGKFCWILNNGGSLSENHHADFIQRMRKVERQIKNQKSSRAIVQPTPKKERPIEMDFSSLGTLDKLLDNHRYNENLDFMSSISSGVLKEIKEVFENYKKELLEIGSDEQLQEAYSHLTPLTIRRRIRFINRVLENCAVKKKVVQTEKKEKTLHKKREKATTAKPTDIQKIVKRFKYLPKLDDCGGVNGTTPNRVHGASVALLYDTVNRTATLFIGDSGSLIIEGAAIVGFDKSKSFAKNVRRPDEFLSVAKNLTSQTKAIQLMNSLKAKETRRLAVRGTDRTLILKAFK